MTKSDKILKDLWEEALERVEPFTEEEMPDGITGKNISTKAIEEYGYMVGKRVAEKLQEVRDERLGEYIEFGDVSEKWLEKYTTKRIVDLLVERTSQGGLHDEPMRETILNGLSLIFKRIREFEFVKGKEPKSSNEIDAMLFPSKKIKEVRGSLDWDIDSWDELNIVIYEINFKEIRFLKIVGGRPTDDSAEKIPVKYLHLGDKTMKILSYFGYNTKVILTNRNAVSRINRYLKAFFKMKENPIVSKDGKYTAEFQVQIYDLNGQPVINKNIHSHGGKFVDEQQIRADEITDIIDDEDEENIYRERDDDGDELNFNH